MRIGMYMYDKEINLNEDATKLFLEQYENAKATMKLILNDFEDVDTRVAMFYMMSLRTVIDDFLEFCTDDIDVDTMQMLLNDEVSVDDVYDFDDFEDDDGEILVDFDEEE